MLENTPMPYPEHSNDARACQYPDDYHGGKPAPVWTCTGTVDTGHIIAAVARAYNEAHLTADVSPTAILGPTRAVHVAHARHLCAYLLVEDYHLTNVVAAQALGRTDHTTVINSRARVVAALDHDVALQQTLAGARDILSGRAQRKHLRRDHGIRQPFATTTPAELAEYRYWRLRALHPDAMGGAR